MLVKRNFSFFCVIELIIFLFTIACGKYNEVLNDFIPFFILFSLIFITGKTRYDIKILDDKIYLSNFFVIKTFNKNDFSIISIYKPMQGAFCIKTKDGILRMKTSEKNYKTIYSLIKKDELLIKEFEKIIKYFY